MRKLVLGLVLLACVESAALACSCLAPGTPEQAREHARQFAPGIVAIVEAETISEFRPPSRAGEPGLGESVRVLRTLYGQAPQTIRLEREAFPSSASCDLLLQKGQRKVLILKQGREGYAMHSLCSDYLTSDEYLPIMIDEARRASAAPNRAGERAAHCPKQRPLSGAG